VRVCRSCGRENPDESDFCACGEYLRWEPTNYMPAVAAQTGSAAAPSASPSGESDSPALQNLDPNVTLAGDAAPAAVHSWPDAPPGAGRAGPGGPGPGGAGVGATEPPPGAAALLLRLPDSDGAASGDVSVSVEPGMRVTILGLIRNQSDVVDNFDLSIRGLPDDWWTIAPATAYLVPYGSGGTYEQEVQIHLHPPRSPQAQARPWTFEVVAASRAYGGEVASAPATVTIGPYAEIATELRPERASGRLKARFTLTVHNRANARAEVDLAAEDTDAECRFRFAQPRIALEPGNGIACPFTVFPPSQKWIGRAVDRRFQVTATPVGVDLPTPPQMATYRQKSWLPWWLAIVAPVVLALAVLAIKLMPKQAVVPNLKGQPTVFAAEKLLNKLGLKLAPKPQSKVDPKQPPGSIADQIPAAGAKAKRGTVVMVVVYAGTGKTKVPSVVGETPGLAQQTLLGAQLALGTVAPQPLDPKGKITSQLPLAGTPVANGTPVNVFLAAPGGAGAAGGAPGAKGSKAGKVAAAGGAAAAAAAAAGAASPAALAAAGKQAGTGPIAIPTLPSDANAALSQLSQLGLTPQPVKQLATVPVGHVAGTVPAAGSKVPKGATVDVLISSGSPQLAFDNGTSVNVIDPTTRKPSAQVPPGQGPQVEPSWSIDGTHLVYSQGGQLMLLTPNTKGAIPKQLTQTAPGVVDQNPSFAPTSGSLVIAFIQRTASSSQLCFISYTRFASAASCTPATGFQLGGQIDWSPDGSTILVLGTRGPKVSEFGLIAFTSSVHFSAQATNWGHGTPQTDVSVPGKGVFAGAFSPNGKQMALVSNIGGDDFHLYIAPAGNFNLTPAEELPVRACQVSWRSDGQELAVMQPNGLCGPDATGAVVGVNLSDPGNVTTLVNIGAHPAWQPVPTGG
jgi:beta-lactam-binding protein with PASTA domain